MITHDHKLIFIHVPKTGGRSVCEAFKQRFDHFTIAHYQREYPGLFDKYWKFAIVRHPLDRMVSSYHYIKEHRRHIHEPIGLCDRKEMPDFRYWMDYHIDNFKGPFNFMRCTRST